MSNHNTQATEEQVLYAAILEKGMYTGLALMVITFALYVFGIVPSVVPLSEISIYWSTPVHEYLVAINTNFLHWEQLPTGWSWMKLLGYGDFLNFLPIAILSGITIVCYMVITPGLFARKDKAMAFMALAEVVILTLAASGLLSVGAH
ncbi:MAG: hypothetical protein L6364_09700 [Desulfobulbaceae bacterium]|jgi:hypothetical protein|nr:hypothetical protein [Desulfobulbaceae bacterium]MDP2002333.1 hypothetical protein [Desulfurivibrionaceae bacterium]PKN21825.1 MAG: DUF1634 domain-containing protein [Deltaproteobacteria bacterium HGW-Deltaproteobacteria-3]